MSTLRCSGRAVSAMQTTSTVACASEKETLLWYTRMSEGAIRALVWSRERPNTRTAVEHLHLHVRSYSGTRRRRLSLLL